MLSSAKWSKYFSVWGLLLFACSKGFSQQYLTTFEQMQNQPLVYQALKTTETITVDGKDDESAWSTAPWSSSFVDIEGDARSAPKFDTRVKMCYDEQYLYLFTQMEEPHIWGDITEHDDIIYHNNDFEVFLKPDVHADHYFEIEINVLNTVFDLFMPRPYRFGGKAQIHWDTKGIKTAVFHQGTANNPHDTDQYWTVEMAIPFAALHSFGTPKTPETNSYWAINFSRVQWQHEVEHHSYTRKTVDGKRLPEDNWVWSPIGLIDMHYPERWGYIQFVEERTEPTLPEYFDIKKLGWNLHYLQQIYRTQHGSFAADLETLPKYKENIQPFLSRFAIEYSPNDTPTSYTISVREKDGNRFFYIDSFGNTRYYE